MDQPPEHHEPIEHETAEDIRAESILLERAIGGWRGIIDSGLPTLVFVVAYVVTSQNLGQSLVAAVASGILIAGWRLVRRESLAQIGAGFAGLLISAGFAKYTGKAGDFYLPGLLTNLAYGSVFLISIVVRWPLIGVFLGFFTSQGTAWRGIPIQRRALAAASWIWVAVFFGRLVVQVPLYLADAVTALGIVKVVMGWPLFLAAAYFTYRVLEPTYRAMRAASPK
ncbi:MAG: DUF3159 domain-containing protein [Candidatus Nanopelagicales bacterium]